MDQANDPIKAALVKSTSAMPRARNTTALITL
jgi:hypothetical protein